MNFKSGFWYLFLLLLIDVSACNSSSIVQSNEIQIVKENGSVRVTEDSYPISDTFSLSTFYAPVPQKILEEVEFFAGGGGSNIFLYCVNEQGGIVFDIVTSEPTVEPGDVVITYFNTNKPVNIRFRFPNGTALEKQLNVGEDLFRDTDFPFNFSGTEFTYLVAYQSQSGKYTISFNDGVQTQYCSFYVNPVLSPRLYPDYIRYVDELRIAIYDATHGANTNTTTNLSLADLLKVQTNIQTEYMPRITLFNFAPNEHVCMFAYGSSVLTAWQVFQVNSNGNLTIELDKPTFINPSNNSVRKPFFVAIGNRSGEVYSFESNMFTRSIVREMPKQVQIKTTHSNYYLYADSDIRSAMIIKLIPGQKLLTNKKQITFVGELWWNVRTDDGIEGWVSNSILTSESTGSSIACPYD